VAASRPAPGAARWTGRTPDRRDSGRVDGQGDPTDNDAGAEQAFGHDALVTAEDETDETDPDREYRPSTTGRSGPY
jgi:hypothetical protein